MTKLVEFEGDMIRLTPDGVKLAAELRAVSLHTIAVAYGRQRTRNPNETNHAYPVDTHKL